MTVIVVSSGAGAPRLSVAAASGVAVAAFLIVAVAILVALVCRRRKRRPPGATLQRHLDMLEAMRSPMRSPPPYSERYVDNTGFTLERTMSTAGSAAESAEVALPPDEPPPPYDAVLKEAAPPGGEERRRRPPPVKRDGPAVAAAVVVAHERSRSDPGGGRRTAPHLGTQALRRSGGRGAGVRGSARARLSGSVSGPIAAPAGPQEEHMYESIPPRGRRGTARPPSSSSQPPAGPPPPATPAGRGGYQAVRDGRTPPPPPNNAPDPAPFSQSTPVHTPASSISHTSMPRQVRGVGASRDASRDTSPRAAASPSVIYFSDVENNLLPPTAV